ncbi:MAG: TlpA family protein disulfide reductase [Aestuariibaculum sp.]
MILFFPFYLYGQINVSEHIQASEHARLNGNKLYFIDFWATWCKPCHIASKYLETLQKQYPLNFYVLSLSQENKDIVKRFVEKHPTELAMAIDFDGETFKKYNVHSLPYGVLLNAKGEKLWEGHPAEFKPYLIGKFSRSNPNEISAAEMFPVKSYKMEDDTNEQDIIDSSIEYSPIEGDTETPLIIQRKKDYINLEGSLREILAYSLGVYSGQVEVPKEINKFYSVKIKLGSKRYNKMFKSLLKTFSLKCDNKEEKGDVLVFNTESQSFWDTDQIDWGDNVFPYLIGDSEIQADNVTYNKMKFQLANLLKKPIISLYDMNAEETGLHDWIVHYKYRDLMLNNLNDVYGIKVEEKVAEFSKYIIKQR